MAAIEAKISHRNAKKIFKLSLPVFLFAVSSQQVFAVNWVIRPTLNVEEVYSDNINLSSDDERSALVTEVSPGVSLRTNSSVNTFDLNYRMQNLYNAGGNSGLNTNNQLQYNSRYQLLRNSLYLDSSSTISQQNVSNRNIASDNITGGGNSTTVNTLSISPYWRPHLQSFADGEVRVGYDRVSTSGGQSALSSTNTYSQNIRLNSGRDFSRFTWFVAFNNQEQNNSDGDDVQFQNSSAELRTYFDREWSVFIRGGHSENRFQTTTDSNRNGFFYTAGAQWRPSARFSVQAGYGNNAFVTVNIRPIRRINWSTTYSNNDIGTNTGDRWQSSLRYNTRRSVWTFNYSEDTFTTQQILLQQQTGTFADLFGISYSDFLNQTTGASTAERLSQFLGIPVENVSEPLVNAVDNGLNNLTFAADLPTLTDEVFISKRADLSVVFSTGKSVFNLSGYRERREFEVSQNQEDILGFSGSWNWNFARRTSSNIRFLWQSTEGFDATEDRRFEATVGVTRNLFSYLNGRVEYRYLTQQSDLSDNEFSENRISASLSMRF
ncbi:TIGR03016 family PEP-CTERM system-associated outer membrane protein [Methylomarinum sp. Ch1-1]|uniref:TIGR03016 family PEP-CTERM system-associated outer membrane protein n=1 Tax=Methylomarinum roseum TaxID=3067653 RepID=A0AAU7NPF4_9GAMM|nr:TIGR03016 family PEP-CTERM system-associated outer membrane protein [Methylomarinum sp. Ch1-1]MDP4521264.1 TIGR03016 family PEP-CTERM system-associated outer membrane protein [Methylomarinum sp. Ch1-1]